MNSKLAFVFPGQGSQKIGMLSDFAVESDVVADVFQRANEVLGYDLWNVVKNGPEEELNNTVNTQPALVAAGYAIWLIWHELKGITPDILAGHSLGEITALLCSGAITFEEAINIVYLRANFMNDAVEGCECLMAACIGLELDVIQEVCEKSSNGYGLVQVANINAPGQIVIAGNLQQVELAVDELKKLGAKKVIPLKVSVPSHCSLMKPAADKLLVALEQVDWKVPNIPVVHNYHSQTSSTAQDIMHALYHQLFNPVRWVDVVSSLVREGCEAIYECGPGSVLSGLNKRIANKQAKIVAINSLEALNTAFVGL